MLFKKKHCAVFTIVKNEFDFLPIWHKYYSNQFEEKDIFILDHESTDNSTKNYKNVRIVNNELTQDNDWLIRVTKEFQKELLKKYEYVLFANADEIIAPDPEKYESISHFLKKNKKEIIRCNGSEVLHLPEEDEFNKDKKILNQRSFWYENNELYSKPLLSKVPLNWTGGWHRLEDRKEIIDKDLKLIHLHRMDFEKCRIRHSKVRKEKFFKPDLEDKKWGWHHFVTDEQYPKWFYSIRSAKILHAVDSLKAFEEDKNKELLLLQNEAKRFCNKIESKWSNLI